MGLFLNWNAMFFQGVDLTNIVTDGPTEGDQTHTIVVALQNLSKLLEYAVRQQAHLRNRKHGADFILNGRHPMMLR